VGRFDGRSKFAEGCDVGVGGRGAMGFFDTGDVRGILVLPVFRFDVSPDVSSDGRRGSGVDDVCDVRVFLCDHAGVDGGVFGYGVFAVGCGASGFAGLVDDDASYAGDGEVDAAV